eukprot:6194104-Pleurochrysis_carterae.AAC.4
MSARRAHPLAFGWHESESCLLSRVLRPRVCGRTSQNQVAKTSPLAPPRAGSHRLRACVVRTRVG